MIFAGVVIFVAAWRERKKELSETSKHGVAPLPGSVTQTENPSLSQQGTHKVEIHNYPPAFAAATAKPSMTEALKESPKHNVVFQGARRFKVDPYTWEEINEDEEGVIAIKACFLNKSIPGRKVSDFDDARAHIVYKTVSGRAVTEISTGVWLGHSEDEYVHLKVNRPECLVLAVWGQAVWGAPYTRWLRSGYAENPKEIDGRPLPQGELWVEITVAGDGGIGLEPVLLSFNLGSKGDVDINLIPQ